MIATTQNDNILRTIQELLNQEDSYWNEFGPSSQEKGLFHQDLLLLSSCLFHCVLKNKSNESFLRFVIAQIGSKNINGVSLAKEVLSRTIKKIVPMVLRYAAVVKPENDQIYQNLAEKVIEQKTSHESIKTALSVTWMNPYDIWNTIDSFDKALCFVSSESNYYYCYCFIVHAISSANNLIDKVANGFMEEVVQILIEMNTEGSQYLHILQKTGKIKK